MSVRQRIRALLRASLLGWATGVIAGLPFQIIEGVRNAGMSSRLLAYDLGMVLVLWCALTFAMAFYWCGCFLLPVVWLASAAWTLRHRRSWIAVSAVFGVLLMAVRLHVWTAYEHDGIGLINFWMWAVFAAAFFLSTSALYARFLRTAATTVA